MENFLRIWAIFIVTVKRMAAQRTMALATLLGIVAAIAITMSIPMYADAAYQKIYNTELIEAQSNGLIIANHPPYTFMFRYIGAWDGPIPLDQVRQVDQYLSGSAAGDLTLPPKLFVRYIDTATFQLFLAQGATYTDNRQTLDYVNFAASTGFADHVNITGKMQPGYNEGSRTVSVLVSQSLADRLKLDVGQAYVAYGELKNGDTNYPIAIPVQISGTWTAKDENDPYWFYSPSGLEKTLMISPESLVNQVLPYINNQFSVAAWFWVMDGSNIHASQIPELLGRIGGIRAAAQQMLPNLRLDLSPEDVLTQFQKSSNSLTVYLYAFSVPLLVMILIFIGLVVDMVVAQRRNEIAVLRSRGASVLQVTGMAVIESLLLAVAGMVIAIPIAQVIVTFFSKAVSFLDFSAASQINAAITDTALRLGILSVLVATLAQVFPTLGAARHTIITYKQERARQSRHPFWQRFYLDVLLLIPAGYGFYQMKQQGSIVVPGLATSSDPFQNPLLLLVPALGIFAATLITLRLLPYIMTALAWLASKTASVGVLMATRYLSRTFGGYSAPLMLLIVTLSLATFTASLAQTLNNQVHDQTYYKVGADISVVEEGKFAGTKSTPYSPVPQVSNGKTYWIYQPIADHLKIAGVTAATRVGKYDINVDGSGGRQSATYLGIDPADFPKAAFWRDDFATIPLSSLMTLLSANPNGVLAGNDYMAANNLQVGDKLTITGAEMGVPYQMDVEIVGIYKFFPTWFPGDAPMVVGNLEHLWDQVGGPQPHAEWLKTAPGADYAAINAAIIAQFGHVLDSSTSPVDLDKELTRPERQGFFGLLSVGFVALAVLTVLGFLLYALFSFRRRFIELGMLRAIGLSTRQMMAFLTSELAFLFLVGLGAGTGLGVGVSSWFIPLLQVGNRMADMVPPFLVRIDWPSVFQIYILFGLLFVGALGVLTALLVRMKIFQAVKLGEAV